MTKAMGESNFSNFSRDTNTKLSLIHDVATVLYFIYGLTAVVGNIILIVGMSKAKLLQYGGFLTLAHYAITDIISGSINILYLPWTIILQNTLMPAWIPGLVLTFGEFSRKVFIVFMAGTKFWAIVSPLSARSVMSVSWYKKAMCITWIASCLASMPFWITRCMYFDPVNYKWASRTETRQITSVYGATVNVLVTLIILTTYPVCFYKLMRHNHYWKSSADSDNSTCSSTANRNQITSRERKLLYLFALNAVIFMLYWIPIYLFELFKIPIPFYGLLKESIRGIQTAYNPIAYWILNKNIRIAMNSLFCCKDMKLDNNLRTLSTSTLL